MFLPNLWLYKFWIIFQYAILFHINFISIQYYIVKKLIVKFDRFNQLLKKFSSSLENLYQKYFPSLAKIWKIKKLSTIIFSFFTKIEHLWSNFSKKITKFYKNIPISRKKRQIFARFLKLGNNSKIWSLIFL